MNTRDRAVILTEWLKHLRAATRYGSKHPEKIADVLTFGQTPEPAPLKSR